MELVRLLEPEFEADEFENGDDLLGDGAFCLFWANGLLMDWLAAGGVERFELKFEPPKGRCEVPEVELLVEPPKALLAGPVGLERLGEIGARLRRVSNDADLGDVGGGANVFEFEPVLAGLVDGELDFAANGELVFGRPKSDFTFGGAKLDLGLVMGATVGREPLRESPKELLIEFPVELIELPADFAASLVFLRRSLAAELMFDLNLLVAAPNCPLTELVEPPNEFAGGLS